MGFNLAWYVAYSILYDVWLKFQSKTSNFGGFFLVNYDGSLLRNIFSYICKIFHLLYLGCFPTYFNFIIIGGQADLLSM